MPWSIQSQIEIAAPPEAVRAKFLDFSNIPTWSPNGFIKKVSPIAPATTLQFIANEPVEVQLSMGTFKSTIVKNTPEEFGWCASMPYIFTGTHYFKFTPSATTPGHTTFIQVEYFSGALGWMAGDSLAARAIGMRAGTTSKWVAFNNDLKAEMEKS